MRSSSRSNGGARGIPSGEIPLNGHIESLKALADDHRLRLYWLLAHVDQQICVAEAMTVLGTSHYNASRHLSQLKRGQLVTSRREGKRVFYRLNANAGGFVEALLKAVRTLPASIFEGDIELCRRLLIERGMNSNESPACQSGHDAP